MAAVLALLRRLDRVARQRDIRRLFRDRQNPLDTLTDEEMFIRYRFRRHTVLFITNLIEESLQFSSKRNSPLLPIMQVLLFLRFVATGSFHLLVGDSMGVSKATAGRAIRRVGAAIARLAPVFINFPSGDEVSERKTGFFSIAGFPNIIGAIDCTHINIQAPTENEVDFVDRRGNHSLNIQMVCDERFIVTNCVAKWPGSVHDARIFNECDLCRQFENGEHDGILIGDTGYGCKMYLLTPYHTADVPCKGRYNDALCQTRVIIEQTFGILKRRFACLVFGLRTTPQRACMYIVACVVLHNIGIFQGDVIIYDLYDDALDEPQIVYQGRQGNGFLFRDHIAHTVFG